MFNYGLKKLVYLYYWNFNDFKYDSCWIIWNFSSCSLKEMNIDPALASSVFVTTITDVIGFLSFLGLGSTISLT